MFLSGSSIDLEQAGEDADAILLGWYPGAGGGRAIAQILFGEVSPSGKLPVTFYRNEELENLPAFTDYSMKGRTYRYYGGRPLYPFGYGLTYGDCRVTGLTAESGEASVTVRNDGTRGTEEVIELYIRDNKSADAPPNPILCGFRRIWLSAGEEKTVQIPIDPFGFTLVNEEGERVMGSGSWTLFAGFGGPDERTKELTGREAMSVSISE